MTGAVATAAPPVDDVQSALEKKKAMLLENLYFNRCAIFSFVHHGPLDCIFVTLSEVMYDI